MNVKINNFEELLTNIKRFKQEVENNNQDFKRSINQYINDDRYSSKAFDKSKRKMKEVVLPIFDQYIIVLQTMEKDLYECINHYHNEVDVINLDEGYLEELIHKVRREREKEERKLELSRRFNTDLAHSFGLSYRFDRSYDAACQLERLLIRKRENLLNFDQYHFFNKTRDEIGKLNYLVKKLDKSNIKGKVTKDSMVCNIVDTLTKFDVPPKIEDYESYGEYLTAVGEYAVKKGLAKKIEINGTIYYEFTNLIKHDYYGTDLENTQLTIACLKDGNAFPYYKYGKGKVIGIPNGLLYVMDEKGNFIKNSEGKYVSYFDMILSGDFKDSYTVSTVTSSHNFEVYLTLPKEVKDMCVGVADDLASVKYSSDISEAILKKDIIDEKGIEYSSSITWKDIENQAKKYIPNGKDFTYFSSEVQFHADGARKNKSKAVLEIQTMYTIKDVAVSYMKKPIPYSHTGYMYQAIKSWDQACSNTDVGRVVDENGHDDASANNPTFKDNYMESKYREEQEKETQNKVKFYEW